MQRKLPAIAAALISLFLGTFTPVAATEPEPVDAAPARAVIDALHATMLETLHGAKVLGYAGRFSKLAPVIAATFDLDFMAEKSVGAHWRKFSDAERKEWRELFARNMVASYASRMGGFHGQEFRIVGSESAGHATITVRTTILDPDKEVIAITYRLREIAAGWRVIDLYLKGTVSELAVRRSDYAGVLRTGGFPALKQSILDKIAEYEAKAG
jgi:phospholipid transport system substrate-binding protein